MVPRYVGPVVISWLEEYGSKALYVAYSLRLSKPLVHGLKFASNNLHYHRPCALVRLQCLSLPPPSI